MPARHGREGRGGDARPDEARPFEGGGGRSPSESSRRRVSTLVRRSVGRAGQHGGDRLALARSPRGLDKEEEEEGETDRPP